MSLFGGVEHHIQVYVEIVSNFSSVMWKTVHFIQYYILHSWKHRYLSWKMLFQPMFPPICCFHHYLVCGLEHVLCFHILGMSSSQLTNSIIFQRRRAQPPTRYIGLIYQFTIYIYTYTYIYIYWIFPWHKFLKASKPWALYSMGSMVNFRIHISGHMNCGDVPGNIALKHRPYISYWCLVGNGWEWGNGMIMTSDYGSFPHSLRLAPVRYGVPPIKKVPEMASHGIIQPTVPNGAFRGFTMGCFTKKWSKYWRSKHHVWGYKTPSL